MFILRLLSWTIINPSVGSPAPRWRPFARLTRGGRERRQSSPPFLGRSEKGVKDKRGSFVDAFYETRADPQQPLASAPSFEGVGALSDRRERDAHPFDNTPGVHLATPPPRHRLLSVFRTRSLHFLCRQRVSRRVDQETNEASREARRDRPCEKALSFPS